ncbi:MAG: hypothetical protein IJI61_02435 [Oscillospiraceae bacterium]|nr:hypothetical protein [Oscillospiraceae bacterium]
MNSNAIAIYWGNIIITWSSVSIFFGVLAFLTMTLAFWRNRRKRSAALGCFFPLAIVLAFILSRLFHWYFNMEQYSASFGASAFSTISTAFTRLNIGSYCLPGVILGIWLAAGITSILGFVPSSGFLLDFAAPGTCLLVAFIRLSALFNGSCIGKRPVTIPILQRFPFCIAVTDSAGNVSYRMAVFFLEFVLMFLAFFLVLRFFYLNRTVRMYYPCKSSGNVWRNFLIYYSAIEIVMDSLRTDSPLMHFTFLTKLNAYSAFISFAQVTAMAFLLYVFLYYLICSIRSDGFSWKHLVCIVLLLLSLAGVGFFGEYSIQRYGREISGYIIMVLSLVVIGAMCGLLYRSCAPEPDYYD